MRVEEVSTIACVQYAEQFWDAPVDRDHVVQRSQFVLTRAPRRNIGSLGPIGSSLPTGDLPDRSGLYSGLPGKPGGPWVQYINRYKHIN